MAADSNAVENLHYRIGGEGVPLVFVHGYLGGGAQWQGQLESPPAGVKIIAPCLPGFGDNADFNPAESIAGFADTMLDFLAAHGIAKFFLLGHSMGGMIAQEMIRRVPERVAALILYGTGALGGIPGRFETMGESRRRVLRDGIDEAAARLPAKWLVSGKASPHYSVAVKIARQAGQSAHLAGLKAMETWDGRTALTDIRCPTLIVWGELDRSYNRSQIDFLHHHISGSILKVICAASHLAHLEFPNRFNEIIYDFLSENLVSELCRTN